MNEITNPQEFYKGFPEAPASDTIRWTDANGFEHMTTIRAWTPASLVELVEQFTAARVANGEVKQKDAAPSKPATPAPAPAPKAANVDTASTNTMEIKKIRIEPQADGKIKVAMFADGHKYPDLYMTRSLDQTLKALAGTGREWNAEYLNHVAEYEISFYADWRNSERLNSKGNPYKDVIALRPLEEDSPS